MSVNQLCSHPKPLTISSLPCDPFIIPLNTLHCHSKYNIPSFPQDRVDNLNTKAIDHVTLVQKLKTSDRVGKMTPQWPDPCKINCHL